MKPGAPFSAALRRSRPFLAGLALLVLATAPACGPSPSKTGRGSAGAPSGGRFVFPLPSEPTTLNFVTGSDAISDYVERLVGDSLVDRDENLTLVPRLAESWEFSNDGRVLTFHLRRGARFHDGVLLTSADVRYTYERVIDPKSRAVGRVDGFLPIERLETPDDTTVRVIYRFPYAPALAAWEVPILPRHLYEHEDFLAARHNRSPVGTGPFRFVSWEAGRRIVLAANQDYWGGRPLLDTLEFQVIPSQETTLQALLAGEIDYAPSLSPVQWEAHAGDPSFARRFATVQYQPLFFYYIAWRSDGSNPYFADPLVRRAMALALDREGYVKNVLRGAGLVSPSLFHPAVLPADPGQPAVRYDPAAPASRGLELWREGNFLGRATPLDAYANCFVRRQRPSQGIQADAPEAAGIQDEPGHLVARADPAVGEMHQAAGVAVDQAAQRARQVDRIGRRPELVVDHPERPAVPRAGANGVDEVGAAGAVQPRGPDDQMIGGERGHSPLTFELAAAVLRERRRRVVLGVGDVSAPVEDEVGADVDEPAADRARRPRRVSGPLDPGSQVLARGRPDRQCRRRPEPGLCVSPHRGIRCGIIEKAP